jgi:hypothetical protein
MYPFGTSQGCDAGEKYIYHLNKSGNKGEDTLTERYKSKLPENFKIRITNPSALIIMGRDDDLSLDQRGDFEIIKRKYRNIVDIITYDDLLRRLRATIKALGSVERLYPCRVQ